MIRVCKTCGVEFPLTEEHFYRNKSFKSGFEYYCKECRKSYKRERYKINNPVKVIPKKLCPLCETEKPLTAEYWHKKSNTKDGYLEQCKVCRNERQAMFRQKRKDEKAKAKYELAMKEHDILKKKYLKLLKEESEEDRKQGLKFKKLDISKGKKYKIGTFKGECIQITDNHCVFKRNDGRCESFLKVDLLMKEYEVVGQ